MRLFLRVVILSFCIWFLSINASSQQLNWALRAGGSSIDISGAVAKDNAGNVYIAGKFSGANVDFDPSPAVFLLSSAGGTDCFVAKYDAAGQFQWAFRFGGNSLDEVHGIGVDQNNNVFITGYFRGTNIDFDPGPGVANVSSNGDAGNDPGYGGDIFIAKYTSAGAYQWAFNIGGTDLYDAGIGLSVDAAGNVYAGGYFTNTADFDPGPGTAVLNSAVTGSIFLAKYSTTGAYQWAFGLGSPITNNALHDIKTDPAGNVYITGYYQGTNLDFDPGPGVAPLSSNGAYEIFVAKYNTAGQYQLAFSVGGQLNDVARGIGLDNAGNMYVIGDFNGTVDFNPGAGTALITSHGGNDAFLAKYSPTGQYLWAFGFGGTPDEYGSKVIIDNGHVFITGSFSGTADLDPSAGVDNLTSAGSFDIYLGKYTLDGEYLCSFRLGGPGSDGGYALVSTAPNVFCLTGAFSGTNIDFDPGATTLNLSSAGAEDIFLTKYTWPDNVPPAGTLAGDVICSGQQAKLTFNATAGTGPFTIVYNNGTNNVTVTNVQSGVPFNIVPNPTVTTTYTLVSIRDANRCSETRTVSGVTATVIVNNCTVDCTFWPVFGSGYSAPIPFSNNISFSYSNPANLVPNSAYNTMTPGNWFTPNPTIATTSPPNATAHNPADIGAINIYPTTINDQGTINFSSPTTTGFYLHIYQTVSNIEFDHSFALVSSDGDLHVGNSGTLTNNVLIADVGPSQSPDDANATLFFPAGITQLKFTFTSVPAVGFDGIKIAFTFPDNCAPCSDWLLTPSLGSKVLIGDLDITGNQVTVEAVFNRSQPLNSGVYPGHLVSKHTDQTNVNYSLFPNGCSITTDVSGYKETFQTCLLDLNRTYHVAMVYDGSSLKYYRDGFLMSQVPCTGNMINNNLAATIAQVGGGTDPLITQFLGYVNEVRIWNVARTQAEIRTYMGASLPNPTTQPGLKGYYVFNDLTNKQGNLAWNGTLSGAASIDQTNPDCDFTPDSCHLLQEQIINDYTAVISLDICKNKLTVSDASAFHVGDTVLLIQMKGAVIDSTNTASFGTITDYKNAGNYEFNYIKAKNGNILELLNVVERQYDLPIGKVQLIRVPYFQNYDATATLTCLPWNGSIGGVLVFNVQNTLTLNANIDVSGKGFRGGADPFSNPSSVNCYENQFYYPVNPDLASGKGEGIAIISSQKSFGKGALANGGGGGNSHNSGGGGGSNGTAGGMGGYNYDLTPCNTTVPFDNRGFGGKPLLYNNATNKIFMGGGGGAGHSNNPEGFQALGGNGAGIIIISADVIKGNDKIIRADGADGLTCSGLGATGCHEGMGGGGAGGTILLNVNSYLSGGGSTIKGGKGADMVVGGAGRLGPGGGGSGGVMWYKVSLYPPGINYSGGQGGVNTNYANDTWGATSGLPGQLINNLQLPIDNILFIPNIDSVRIKDSITGCSSFDFKGLGYINTFPVANWQWYFGDGNTANTQNTTHTYTSSGSFTVKLVVTDINGCKDSITKDISTTILDFDFSYQLNSCSPLTVQFNSIGNSTQNPYWSFGDATTASGVLNPVHTYPAENTYIVKYSVSSGACTDTVTKTISLFIIPDDIIVTHDTTICFGATKQLLTKSSLNFCWSPVTYLNDPNSPNPVTSTPQNITYYYTAQVTGNNLITNGDFTQGNTGFTSAYNYATPNITEGQYYIGTNPQAWNGGLSPCGDHTTGNGNMMMINGAPVPDVNVWKQTIAVTPNTNYAFSTWLQALWPPNPAQLRFSINGKDIGTLITASLPTCTWTQFYTTWNSGNNTTAVIAIVNKNIAVQGNDFALDDISFAPVFIKRDSVRITIDTAAVKTNDDIVVCSGTPVQLNTTGAATYSWSPSGGLSNTSIANPIASPLVSTQYFVTGTNLNGCTAKDSVTITANPKPTITKLKDTTICKNASVQLSASGGTGYLWSPAATLNNPAISNPVASPTANTTYYVSVTDANTCNNIDSVKVSIRPDPVFTISPAASACINSPVQLTAGGGNIYSWQPASSLNNAAISNPVATPAGTTNYSVNITETVCNISTTLTTTVNVKQLPSVQATKSNDLDCSNDRSQLNATGAQTYLWSPASSLNNSSVSNPVAMPTGNTMYIVKGTDASGCINYDSVKVDFLSINASGYFMPNAFTPNNDGKNDCYGIRFWGIIQDLEFSIFNRWGERVFFTKNPNDCWDGTYKGQMQPTAVFVYMIKAKTLCGDTFKKGLFTLIR
jgi:gliding motility-associated-like protein